MGLERKLEESSGNLLGNVRKERRKPSAYGEITEIREVTFPEGDIHYSKNFMGKSLRAYQVYYSSSNSHHWFIDGLELNSYEVTFLLESGTRIKNNRKKVKGTQ